MIKAMMMGHARQAAFAALAALLIGGVALAQSGAAPEDAAGTNPLADTHWLLTELNGAPSAEGVETMLAFTADGLGGRGGCNSYGGNVVFEGDNGIAISEVFSTMMACAEPQMAQEQAYFSTLETVVSYAREGDTLTFMDADDTAIMVFNAISEV